jgi:hypothetical protein
VQQFNSYYVLRAQKQLALASSPLPEFNIDELESFREEFAAFLRDFELWEKEIAEYLQSLGLAEFNAMYQFAPTPSFERMKSFRRSTSLHTKLELSCESYSETRTLLLFCARPNSPRSAASAGSIGWARQTVRSAVCSQTPIVYRSG